MSWLSGWVCGWRGSASEVEVASIDLSGQERSGRGGVSHLLLDLGTRICGWRCVG